MIHSYRSRHGQSKEIVGLKSCYRQRKEKELLSAADISNQRIESKSGDIEHTKCMGVEGLVVKS